MNPSFGITSDHFGIQFKLFQNKSHFEKIQWIFQFFTSWWITWRKTHHLRPMTFYFYHKFGFDYRSKVNFKVYWWKPVLIAKLMTRVLNMVRLIRGHFKQKYEKLARVSKSGSNGCGLSQYLRCSSYSSACIQCVIDFEIEVVFFYLFHSRWVFDVFFFHSPDQMSVWGIKVLVLMFDPTLRFVWIFFRVFHHFDSTWADSSARCNLHGIR